MLLFITRGRRFMACALSAAFIAVVPHATSAVPAPTPPPISWTRCAPENTGLWPELGNRLSCARIPMPVDHLDPAAGTIDVGIVRIRALRTVERKGALFFNFGGPGDNPMETLPAIAASWITADPLDELTAPQRRISDHYDMVAVVPRGLRGGWVFECLSPEPVPFEFIPSSTDEANLRKVETHGGDVARSCGDHPFHYYVNSEQNARDLEYVRRAMGEPAMNFFGLSYGSWLGSWYAAMFPEHVGKMVFDSSMDVTGSYNDAVNRKLIAEDEALERRVLRPVAARPLVYGMGNDMEALRERIRNMHAWTRRELAPVIDTPAQYVAAIRMDEWMRVEADVSRATFERRIERYSFSPDERTNIAIVEAAHDLLPVLFRETATPAYDLGPDADAVHIATFCNDAYWPTTFEYWRDRARLHARQYPTSNGSEIYTGLTCAQWGERRTRRPDIERLAEVPPFLIVQAEHDHFTPLAGAEHMRDTFGNARLIVARNMENHGVFGFSRTPCVQRAVGAYLLDGAVPEDRTISCLNEPFPRPIDPDADSLHRHTEFWRRLRFGKMDR